MNTKIKYLLSKLDNSRINENAIKACLQKAYNEVFDDSVALAKACTNAQSASEYGMAEYGEIYSWYRFAGLSDFQDCREYFEAWVSDSYCLSVDWDNECLMSGQGDSITIQDDAGRDNNGVYYGHKLIIDEKEYRDDDGEVNESKRNALIEAYMEKNGEFPGVFRVTRYGNVFPVSTKE